MPDRSNTRRRNSGTIRTTFRHDDGSIAERRLSRKNLQRNSGTIDGRGVHTLYSREWESDGVKLIAIGTEQDLRNCRMTTYKRDDLALLAASALGMRSPDGTTITPADA